MTEHVRRVHDRGESVAMPRPVETAKSRPNSSVAGVLALQHKVGNRAVAAMLDRLRPVQRWAALGDEFYHSPPHDAGGTGVIAGVPEPGQGRVVTKQMPVFEATETEWRDLLGQSGDHPAVTTYAFLRAAMLDDPAWHDHVRAHYDGIPPQAELTREVGTNFSTADRRIRQPTLDQQLALAKAIYLRGRAGLGFDFNRFDGLAILIQAFLGRMQPILIERMALNNVRFGPEMLGPVTRATTNDQQVVMIGSAAGTITRAAASFAAWDQVKRAAPRESDVGRDAEQRKASAMREAEMASMTLRGVADTSAAMRRDDIERIKGLIGIAMSAVPLPGVGTILARAVGMSEGLLRTSVEAVLNKAAEVLVADRIKDGLAEALARSDHTERIEDIRTQAVWAVREFRLGDEEDDFVNTVNAALTGAGR